MEERHNKTRRDLNGQNSGPCMTSQFKNRIEDGELSELTEDKKGECLVWRGDNKLHRGKWDEEYFRPWTYLNADRKNVVDMARKRKEGKWNPKVVFFIWVIYICINTYDMRNHNWTIIKITLSIHLKLAIINSLHINIFILKTVYSKVKINEW